MYEALVYKGSIAKQVSFLPSVPLTIYHPAKEFLNPAIKENILCMCVCMCVCVCVCVCVCGGVCYLQVISVCAFSCFHQHSS